jgi:predicted permease
METFWQDVRFALRVLAKSPGFTVIAVITLALGIGANTAIFSVANSFLFRPLPVKDADRLVVVAVQSSASADPNPMSYLDYQDYRQQSDVFTDMTGYVIDLVGLGASGRADRIVASYVPSNFFSMLGLHPAAGRLIEPGEGDLPKTGPVVVLGYGYWQKRFAGDPSVIGRPVSVDGLDVTVIGVVQKEFTGPYNVVEMDAYLPIGMYGAGTNSTRLFTARSEQDIRVLATLKPGISAPQAQTALGVIAQRLAQQYPQDEHGQIVRVFPEKTARPEPSAADSLPLVATVFLTLVGLVLLVACVNVANLLLARAAARQSEMAIRAALGAGRMRLIRQLLTESILLAAGGGALGALLGIWVCHALEGLHPIGDFQISLGVAFDWRVFSYVAGASAVSGILAGLLPAMRVSRANLNETLREGGRGTIGGTRQRLRSALVTAQVAGSIIVLVSAGLFARSLKNAESVDLGFDPHNVLNIGIDPGLQGYDQARTEVFFRELLRRAKATPGVESASLAFTYPMSYYSDGASIYAEGQALPPDTRAPGGSYNCISPDYFNVMRIPIVEGRAFNDADTASSQRVAIVNQAMANRIWPGQDPVGLKFSYKGQGGPLVMVVGIARDSKYSGIIDPIRNYFFLPQSQDYKSTHVLQVRTAGVQPESLIPAIEADVRELDPNLPVFDVMSMERALTGANGFFLYQMGAAFAAVLGGLGLILAIVGLYGVVSYNVSQRRHEIGVRMALGANPALVFRLVLRLILILVGSGVVLGSLAALGVTQFLSSLLVGVAPWDPLTYAAVDALLVVVALVACYLPARRATRVDPSTALRYE